MASKPRRKKPTKPPVPTQNPPTQVASGRMVGSAITIYNDPSRNGYKGIEAPNLAGYERALRMEPSFAAAVRYLTLAMLAGLGPYNHPDAKIQAFVRKMFERMEGNIYKVLGDLIYSGLWSGKGVSEMLIEPREGLWWLKAVVNYHPASISLVPNRRGILTDNEKDVAMGTILGRTGVWQEIRPETLRGVGNRQTLKTQWGTYVRIPLAKTIIVRHNDHHNNIHGQSIFAPAWIFYEMKWKTLEDWMVTAEKYGSPTVALIVPNGITSNMIADGNGGMRPETVAEGASRGLSQMTSASGLVLERPPGTDKNEIQIQPITTGNNFGSSYKETVATMDYQMFTAIGVPPLLFLEHSGGLGAGEISQTQADNFKQLLVSFYREFVEPFTEQCIGRIVRWNFGVEDCGTFSFKPFDPGAAKRIMETVNLALRTGLIDMSQELDLQHARALLGWAPAEGDHLKALLRGNKLLMENIRQPNMARVDAAQASADAQIEVAKINNDTKSSLGKEQLKLSKKDQELREREVTAKEKTEKQKVKADVELKKMTAEHQHEQNMLAIKKGLVAQPQAAAPTSPKAPKPTNKPKPKKESKE